jgi:hypothetical protein
LFVRRGGCSKCYGKHEEYAYIAKAYTDDAQKAAE